MNEPAVPAHTGRVPRLEDFPTLLMHRGPSEEEIIALREWMMNTDFSTLPQASPEEQAALLAMLPPPSNEPITEESTNAMLVSASVLVPYGVFMRLKAHAEAAGITYRELVWEWIEAKAKELTDGPE